MQVYWDDVQEGDELPAFTLVIDPTRIVKQVSGSQDFNREHHDVPYIRESGHKDIFMNTGFMQGCFSRLLGNWIGDEGWLKKFTMQMKKMNHPGDVISLKGVVRRKYIEEEEYLVELDVWAENEREGVTTPSYALVRLPRRDEAAGT